MVDKVGTMQDAIDCLVRMANLKEYSLKEYPEKKSLLDQFLSGYKKSIKKDLLKDEIGVEQIRVLNEIKQLKQMIGVPQTRIPYSININ